MGDDTPNRDYPKSIEVEGHTVEEAIKRAIEIFNVSRDNIIVKVVSEEKKGLFGMKGARPAKIKATLKKSNNSS